MVNSLRIKDGIFRYPVKGDAKIIFPKRLIQGTYAYNAEAKLVVSAVLRL